MKVKVYDKFGHIVRAFNSWSEANKFRIIMNRPDWTINLDFHKFMSIS